METIGIDRYSPGMCVNWIMRIGAQEVHSAQLIAGLGEPHTVLPYDHTGAELIHVYEAEREALQISELVTTLMIALRKAEAVKAKVPCTVNLHLRVHKNDGMPFTLPPLLLQTLGRLEAALELCVDAEEN